MRTLHRLDRTEPCSVEPSTPIAIPSVPLEPPCPVEWLRPPQMSQPPDPNRLWYPMSSDELENLDLPDDDKIGSVPQEVQLRRLKLQNELHSIPNPTSAQILDSITKIETEEIAVDHDLALRRYKFFQQLQSVKENKGVPHPGEIC
jgi:hypothetical protein